MAPLFSSAMVPRMKYDTALEPHPEWKHAAPHRRHVIRPLGVPIVLHEWGDPEADPVVLVHGFLDHGRGFEPIALPLAEHYRVISYDARGHGESGWCDGYAWSVEVAELVEILRWTGKPCFVIGHSRGGAMATDAAIQAPETVRKLINVDGFGPPPEGFVPPGIQSDDRTHAERMEHYLDRRRQDSGERTWRAYESIEALMGRRQRQNPRLGGSWLEHFVRIGSRRTETGFVWRADPMVTGGFGPWRPQWAARQWPSLERPMLAVIGSEQDTWGPLPESMLAPRLARIPELERATVDDAGHFVHMEQPEATVELARDWFAS